MSEYKNWDFLWPPRPTRAITPAQFDFFERRGWIGQLKLNGTCAVIGLGPDGQKETYNRHNEPLQWKMPQDVEEILRAVVAEETTWTVLVAELLHSKVSGGPKNTVYLHDTLVWRNVFLEGETYASRQEMLRARFEELGAVDTGVPLLGGWSALSENVWLANNWSPKQRSKPGLFGGLYQSLSIKRPDFVEGIVLKNPDAKLEPCTRESANGDWSAKCRFATKNYAV